jgi:hypothetical protein
MRTAMWRSMPELEVPLGEEPAVLRGSIVDGHIEVGYTTGVVLVVVSVSTTICRESGDDAWELQIVAADTPAGP